MSGTFSRNTLLIAISFGGRKDGNHLNISIADSLGSPPENKDLEKNEEFKLDSKSGRPPFPNLTAVKLSKAGRKSIGSQCGRLIRLL